MAKWHPWQSYPARYQLTCNFVQPDTPSTNRPLQLLPNQNRNKFNYGATHASNTDTTNTRVKSADGALSHRTRDKDKNNNRNINDRNDISKLSSQIFSDGESMTPRGEVISSQIGLPNYSSSSVFPNSSRVLNGDNSCSNGTKNPEEKLTSERTDRVMGTKEYNDTHGSSKYWRSRPSSTSAVHANPRGKATMYFSVTSPRGHPSDCDLSLMTKSFPSRNSSFVSTFKQHQVINSVRQRNFEEQSTMSPRSAATTTGSSSAKLRRPGSSPSFPITQLTPRDEHDIQQRSNQLRSPRYSSIKSTSDHRGTLQESKSHFSKPRAKTAMVSRSPSKSNIEFNLQPKPKKQSSQPMNKGRPVKTVVSSVDISQNVNPFMNTILPFDEPGKPFIKNPLYQGNSSPRRYSVRKLDDATMFINDDKIIFIKKKATKNESIQCPTVHPDELNYLAHLRKIYLKEPKDLAKCMIVQGNNNKETLIRERLEYDKRTDNILNYYTRIDDRENAFAWAMSLDKSSLKRSSSHESGFRSARAQSSPGMRRDPGGSNPTTPRTDRPATSSSFREHRNRPPTSDLCTSHDTLSDWNLFVKFNTQSILHERQFYLQTPLVEPTNDSKMINDSNNHISRELEAVREASNSGTESCVCRMCEIEMKMSQNGSRAEHDAGSHRNNGEPTSTSKHTVDERGAEIEEGKPNGSYLENSKDNSLPDDVNVTKMNGDTDRLNGAHSIEVCIPVETTNEAEDSLKPETNVEDNSKAVIETTCADTAVRNDASESSKPCTKVDKATWTDNEENSKMATINLTIDLSTQVGECISVDHNEHSHLDSGIETVNHNTSTAIS